MPEDELLFFFGTECVHCHKMDPLIEKVEKELNIKLAKFEVWHNSTNAALLASLDKGYCGGIPFFFNRRTGKWICGEVPYDQLKKWATGK